MQKKENKIKIYFDGWGCGTVTERKSALYGQFHLGGQPQASNAPNSEGS